MSSVDDYLNEHPELHRDEAEPLGDADGLKLDVAICAISELFVKFTHMGTEYSVARHHVTNIVARADASAGAATITVDRNASLLASYAVSAADLARALPFALSVPPATRPAPIRRSERELAWRRSTRYAYASDYPSLEIYLNPFSTSSACDSATGDGLDDTIADDERADY